MNLLIMGNVIALIAASINFILGIIKDRKRIIYVQTIQFFAFAISTFILGGISGAIANIIGAIRNILSYKEKLTNIAIFFIILISTALILIFNNLGIIGLLPLCTTIIYTVFINEKNILKFKILFTITIILWLIYDISIKSYTSAVFNLFATIGSIITTYQIYKNNIKQ